ncbi:D-arabinose 1-dehydrogenase-like Zn-dependent alcohol dehydrogenase [Rhizobium binae]|uniref:D-arabinose 1-dehydrogenase-like Zn-dependent alcohol dehydrogenase n=1 Tax=Rhizobium binae TaxID=1138190 RepID=A0ABV2MGC1_9HYPH
MSQPSVPASPNSTKAMLSASPGCTTPACAASIAKPAGKRFASTSTIPATAATAEYVIASAAFAARLPAGVDFAEIAPILCAGVTTYKGLKETEARPGEWVAISGVGGLGHVAIQYAKAMGLKVIALDIAAAKLDLARHVGADLALNALSEDTVETVLKATSGGAHGVLVTAVSPPAFSQAIGMVRRKGTVSLVGLPPGNFPTPIFDVVLKRITVRGSIVGTRRDLDEALAFAAEGRIRAAIAKAPLDDVNDIFTGLKAGTIEGRMVFDLAGQAGASAAAEQ